MFIPSDIFLTLSFPLLSFSMCSQRRSLGWRWTAICYTTPLTGGISTPSLYSWYSETTSLPRISSFWHTCGQNARYIKGLEQAEFNHCICRCSGTKGIKEHVPHSPPLLPSLLVASILWKKLKSPCHTWNALSWYIYKNTIRKISSCRKLKENVIQKVAFLLKTIQKVEFVLQNATWVHFVWTIWGNFVVCSIRCKLHVPLPLEVLLPPTPPPPSDWALFLCT